MKRILVLGAFGYRKTLFDGQTIKTRNLYDLVKNNYPETYFFDTVELRFNRWNYVIMLWECIKSKFLFYLPAHNNLTYFFPIIFILSFIFRIKIHYFVVGGWLKEILIDKPIHRRMLRHIAGIHCETQLMKQQLEECYGIRNIDIFPNFRINNFVPKPHHQKGMLKLVFMARMLKMKGLDTIFKMGDKIKENNLSNKISLDFYGPLIKNSDDEIFFNENIIHYPFMKYFGPLEPNDIQKILEKYDALLLPTHFYTEGFPGSILDAYIAGIPVIVTKWKHATEFVTDGESGFIIPFDDDGNLLFNKVQLLLNDEPMLFKMKMKARAKWAEFSAEKALTLIKTYIK